MRCPYCKSENAGYIDSSTIIKKIPEKITRKGNVTCTQSSTTKCFTIKKYLCLECGYCYEQLNGDELEKYKE